MITYTAPKTALRIPVIDFADAYSPQRARREALAWEIHKTSREVGFFYIVNHGVPQALVEGQFDWARRFFALPQASKSAIDMRLSPSGYGYERMGAQVLDEGSPADLKEGFQFGFDIPHEHAYVRRGLLRYGHNQWPQDLPGFALHSRQYYDAMRALSHRLLSVIALSLGMTEDFFEPVLETPIATQRMLHYPPQAGGSRNNRIGAGAHTDWGLVTILAQDAIGGLEICDAGGEWVSAPPIDASFVVNLGDLLQRWSNDLYHSNPHRVLNTGVAPRYSLPFFQDGDQAAVVACLPGCCSAERPARYAPCTIGEYLEMKVRQTFGAVASA